LDDTGVGAVRRTLDAVLAEVERRAPVESNAEQKHLRSHVVQPCEGGMFTEVTVRVMIIHDLRSLGSQRGK
jgi:hypothetical protein